MDIMIAAAAAAATSAAITAIIAGIIGKTRSARSEAAILVEKAGTEAELKSLRRNYDEFRTESARALERQKAEAEEVLKQAKEDAAKVLAQEKAEADEELKQAKEEADARLKAAIEASDKVHKEAMDALQARFDETVAKVSAQMKAQTDEMLKARQKEFAESSNLSLGQIVTPLKENIDALKKTMEEDSKAQAERNGEMRERLKNLMEHSEAARKSADELAAAFKHGTKMQGDWGETILEELLSNHGLTEGVHFDSQPYITDADGKHLKNADGHEMRPDVILHLDERREVIIDSKVSLTAYVEYVNAATEEERSRYLKEHIDSIRKHVKELADKDYSSYVKAPKLSAGYVIMFVPNVGALWTALNADPTLWRKAADANVYIADEQSLYGALKVVSLTWTQIIQVQNQQKVYELANEMLERVGMFMERYRDIGQALNNASKAYNEANKKLETKGQSIINTSNKLIQLGAKSSTRHPLTEPHDLEIQAQEQS